MADMAAATYISQARPAHKQTDTKQICAKHTFRMHPVNANAGRK